MNWKVPLFDTSFGDEELAAIQRPLKAGWLTMGDETAAVEREIATRVGVKHCFAVTNGTAALHMACAALGLGPGDEVLCPSLTFVASANSICYTGATPVFCECKSDDDLTIDPADAAKQITPRTRAMMLVHYAGFACDMPALKELAEKHRLSIIEDCAHSLFTKAYGKACGAFGDAGCFSFFSNKNATCGEGGAVVTDRDDLAEKFRLLRSHGMTTLTLDRHRGHAFTYDVLEHGFNYRIDEIRAALLRAQLAKLDAWLERRRRLFALYCEHLPDIVTAPFRTLPGTPDWPHTAVHIMPVLLPEGAGRESVMTAMKEFGVQTSIHYRPVHKMSAFAAGIKLPRTESLAERQLTLPLYPAMRDEDITYVCECLERHMSFSI